MAEQQRPAEHDFPSNKFYPPHIDPSQSLTRERILSGKLPNRPASKKAYIIEAQAGQGKTTLVWQFLERHNAPHIWYQIGPEDSDPYLLLRALLSALKQNLQDFTSSQLSQILSMGSVGSMDLIRCAEILLQDLGNYLKKDLYLVFDDLHRIEFGQLTNSLLQYFLDCSPPHLHFILTTRQKIEIKSKTLRNGSHISYLNTKDLALDNIEIEQLFNRILKQEISSVEAHKIQELTNGWIMGILLAGHPMSGRGNFWREPRNRQGYQTGHMLEYFEEEIFAQIPTDLHKTFQKLSFLHQIPVELAEELSNREDIGQALCQMARKNYFLYPLDANGESFRFHHFFQEYLQQLGGAGIAKEQIKAIHIAEAKYYLDREQLEQALTSYKAGGDFCSMEKILKERGMELIIKNRTYSILALLSSIPDTTLDNHPWLVLYSGLMRIDFEPDKTLPIWHKAVTMFRKTNEEIGEIIALTQIIYFHFVISGEYRQGLAPLGRCEELFLKNRARLPAAITILAARNLASGYCFFSGEMDKAREYISIATSLANRYELKTFIASSHFIQGYIELLSGNRAKFLLEAESCYTLFTDPLVGESNRLTMRVMSLCYLSMIGDHGNYQIAQQALIDSINETIVDQTVASPYLSIWSSNAFFSAGKTNEALAVLAKGFGANQTASSNHMESQFFQWQAFGLALTGKSTEAEALIKKAELSRKAAGGFFYEIFNRIICGAVYTRLAKWEKAKQYLDRALREAKDIGSTYLLICALFNRSYLNLKKGSEEFCLSDLEAGLTTMKISGFDHFWSWEPTMMMELLALATAKEIEKDFTLELARKRLKHTFTASGEPIALLGVTLLDGFSLDTGGQHLGKSNNLTSSQRELMGLLFAARGRQIPQEKVQLALWPNSSPKKARKSFDTLLTRLRQKLSSNLPLLVKNYISLQKGILSLNNYRIDALNFQDAAKRGISHAKNANWYQASLAFQKALGLWGGSLPEDSFRSEEILKFNDSLLSLLTEMALIWATNLEQTGNLKTATVILEKVLKANTLEERILTKLYKVHLSNKKPLRARELLVSYRESLLRAEYSPDECEEFIKEIIKEAVPA